MKVLKKKMKMKKPIRDLQYFYEYLNENDYLYSGIDIDNSTINLINSFFEFYKIEPLTFYEDFRVDLKLYLPRFYDIISLKVENELNRITNRKIDRRLLNDTINKELNDRKSKSTRDDSRTNTNKTNGSNNSNNTFKNQQANKMNPLTINGGDFTDLFSWDSSTEINENKNSETLQNTISNSGEDTSIGQEKFKNKESSERNVKSLSDTIEEISETSDLIVNNVSNIIDFYLNNKNDHNLFLLQKLSKNFILMESF